MPVSRARTGETEECCWVPLAQLGRERTVTEGGTRAPDAIHQRLQCGAKRFEFGFPQDAEHSTYELNVGGIPSALDNGSMWQWIRRATFSQIVGNISLFVQDGLFWRLLRGRVRRKRAGVNGRIVLSPLFFTCTDLSAFVPHRVSLCSQCS